LVEGREVICSIAYTANLNPANSRLWKAYVIAPVVAPLTLAALVVVLSLVAGFVGKIDNPAGAPYMPMLAIALGLPASYGVAGVLGLPIAFALRRAQCLNGLTIHAAAAIWAVLFSLFVGVASPTPASAILVFCVVVIPILSSATVFWAIVGHDELTKRDVENGNQRSI
jgi:hypothetical protein